MATTDLPTDIRTGLPRYELENPLERLQTMLNSQNIDIESMDMRGQVHTEVEEKEMRVNELSFGRIEGIVDRNPQMTIPSNSVRDLNQRFDRTMVNSNPNYIFRDDIRSRDNVNTIRMGNASFAKARDLLVVPPPIDAQQKIFELLSGT